MSLGVLYLPPEDPLPSENIHTDSMHPPALRRHGSLGTIGFPVSWELLLQHKAG